MKLPIKVFAAYIVIFGLPFLTYRHFFVITPLGLLTVKGRVITDVPLGTIERYVIEFDGMALLFSSESLGFKLDYGDCVEALVER